MSLRSRPARLLASLAALTLAAAACGDDDDDDTATETTAEASDAEETTETTEESSDTTAAADGAGTVEVAESDLGEILTSDGRTLYLFMPDNGSAPTCYDDCASAWPPLLAEGDVAVGEGLDAALFATAPRDDGGEQVTVDGWPLYFFANDAAPGDTNGQGVGGVWFAVAPDGSAIEA